MTHLLVSIVALMIGPALYRYFRASSGLRAALDGFIFVSMGGLIVLDILPASANEAGWIVLVFALVGLAGPALLERNFHRIGRGAHLVTVVLGLAGLALHAALDGIACADGTRAPEHFAPQAHAHLPFAVVLHSLPVGLTVWWLVRRAFGFTWAVLVLALLASSRLIGYFAGEHIFAALSPASIACTQSLVAGSLLHVVLHRHHEHEHAPGHAHDGHAHAQDNNANHENENHENANHENETWERAPAWCAGLGGIVGIVLLIGLLGSGGEFPAAGAHDHDHAHAQAHDGFAQTLLELTAESAPAILLGYLVAGLLGTFLSGRSIAWMARGGSFSRVLRGVVVGLPLPVCSCGVVPIYRSLVLRGTPATAAFAFLVATPELGIDAVLLSVPLLGGPFTLVRVAAAALLALLVGAIVGKVVERSSGATPVVEFEETRAASGSVGSRVLGGLRVGFFDVFDHTGPWILLGLVIAALVGPVVEGSFVTELSPSIQVFAFALLGIPIYVCASGATPLVAVLILGGVSPGAALAFLLTGPATNVSTFGVIQDLHGRRAAVLFSVCMLAFATILGLITNAAASGLARPEIDAAHSTHMAPWRLVLVAALILLALVSILRRGPRAFVGKVFSAASMAGASALAESPPSAGGSTGVAADRGLASGAASSPASGTGSQIKPCCHGTPAPPSPSD